MGRKPKDYDSDDEIAPKPKSRVVISQGNGKNQTKKQDSLREFVRTTGSKLDYFWNQYAEYDIEREIQEAKQIYGDNEDVIEDWEYGEDDDDDDEQELDEEGNEELDKTIEPSIIQSRPQLSNKSSFKKTTMPSPIKYRLKPGETSLLASPGNVSLISRPRDISFLAKPGEISLLAKPGGISLLAKPSQPVHAQGRRQSLPRQCKLNRSISYKC